MNKSIEQKKNNYFKAILFCFLTCLAGGVLFGVIYGIGYYLYVLPVAEVLLGVIVYKKYAKNNALNTVISVVLSTLFVLAFNLASIIICEVIFLAKDAGITFNQAFEIFFYYVKNDAAIRSAFDKTISSASGVTLLGTFVAIIYLIFNTIAANRQNKGSKTKPSNIKNETEIEKDAFNEFYNNLYNDVQSTIKEYVSENNSEKFKQHIKDINAKYIVGMDEGTKTQIKLNNEKLLANNPEKLKALTLQTMNKLLK